MQASIDPSLRQHYTNKTGDYFERPRTEMLELIPKSCKRILDVGCAKGAFARAVKLAHGAEAWGIEPDQESAKAASNVLDRVLAQPFSPTVDLPSSYFDCISFNDVLEHMLDPEGSLAYASRLLTPNGVIVASIPNVSHFPNLWKLSIRGEWKYSDHGILDRTHLRFFTRSSIADLFATAGFSLRALHGINSFCSVFKDEERIWKYYRLVRLIGRQSIHDMRYLQFAVVAAKSNA